MFNQIKVKLKNRYLLAVEKNTFYYLLWENH